VARASVLAEVGIDWQVAGFGDLNGDETRDMVLSRINQGHRDREGYVMSKNQVARASVLAEVGVDWQVAGVGDLNGDGTTDMVLSRITQGHRELEGYLISNNQVARANVLAEVGVDWQVAGFGDLNGDGTTDMVLSRVNQGH